MASVTKQAAMIVGNNIDLSLTDTQILSDVSVAISLGEVVALCGPNGAGKSTLLSCLAGEHRSCENNIIYFDKKLSELTAAERSQRRVVLEQSPTLSAEFTLSELIELGAPITLAPEQFVKFREELISEFGFQVIAKKFVSELSGGQQHRAHLARVLLQLKANLTLGYECFLFLDEPTASLDMGHQINVLSKMRQLATEGVGVLVVLHDLNLAAAFADRIVLMKDGQIQHDGPCELVLTDRILSDIYETPIFVETAHNGQIIIQADFK